MTWLPVAQFILTFVLTIIMGALALYVRALKAEFWTKIFEEADERYVSVKDCALLHSAELSKLRADIGEWRVFDRHAMRNEATKVVGESEERLSDKMDGFQREIERIWSRIDK